MGLFRYLLSLSVLISHEGNLLLTNVLNGSLAVEVFFAISGFYMTMVLDNKYYNPRDFYLSRFFRIFPLYWMTLVVVAVLKVQHGSFSLVDLAGGAKFYVLFSNITLFFQDVAAFLELRNVQNALCLFPIFDSEAATVSPGSYMLLTVAWSLSLEIYFYILAPFLYRLETPKVLFLMFLSLVAKGGYFLVGHRSIGFNFKFFPFELFFFLYGIVIYRGRESLSFAYRFRMHHYKYFVYAILTVLVLFCGYLDVMMRNHASYFLPYLLPMVIPTIFELFKMDGTDRSIGELSYPVYLFASAFGWMLPGNTMLLIIITFVLSLVTVHFFERPINFFRHKMFCAKKV